MTVDLGVLPRDGVLPPVRVGRYVVRVREVRERRTGAGAVQFGVCLVVERGEFAGRVVWTNLTPVLSALGRLRAFLRAIGEAHEGSVEVDTGRWVGRRLVVKLGVETYAGRQTNTVLKFLPVAELREKQALQGLVAGSKDAAVARPGSM